MPNIIALSPHFPPNFIPFWLRLKQTGAKVLGVADIAWEALPESLRESLDEYWCVEDMQDLDELEQACLELQRRHGRIDFVESHNEYWLEAEAALRSHLQIEGPNLDTIVLLKRKSQMQTVYQQAQIPIPGGVLATSLRACQDLVEQTDYPLVAKPDIGVGAAATYKISSADELEDFWAHRPEVDYFLQGYVQGELFSFDGLVDAQGEIQIMASHRFNHGIMEIINQDLDLFYHSLREIPASLVEIGKRAVEAFQVRQRFFHFEFFKTGSEQWTALEVNMRPPGGMTLDMMNFANDCDLFQAYADLIVKGQTHLEATRPYVCAYVARKNRDYRYSHDEIMRKYSEMIVYQDQVAELFYPIMGSQGYVLRHSDLDTIEQTAAWIQELA